LKNFFSTSSSASGRGSSPSTHESANHVATQQGEVVQRAINQLENVAETNDIVDDSQASELIKVFLPDIHLISDPGLRIPIERFHPNIRGDVKKAYLLKGPTRPHGHNFPRNHDNRSFSKIWFKKNDWLEYSVEKDAAFCFYCFLFKQEPLDEKFGHDVFIKVGFRTWKNAYHAFPLHVGGPTSCHNRARTACDDFRNERASINHRVERHDINTEARYETRLTSSLLIARFLISQGLAFRGHNESPSSLNKGNFLEMLEWFKNRNSEVKAAFEEFCPQNAKMTSHIIQKDLTESCAIEVSKVIKEEIGDKLFTVLIDESRDISVAEQMAVIVRFV
jgi:hypothetical protein